MQTLHGPNEGAGPAVAIDGHSTSCPRARRERSERGVLYSAQPINLAALTPHSFVESLVHRSANRLLFILLAIYVAASFVHFVHNAEFLSAYPGLPASWSRSGVYLAWLGMTAVGAVGTWLIYRRFERVGLPLLAAYALLGMDSLGHYVLAPLSAHSMMMNATILFEVTAAALVLIEVVRRACSAYGKRPLTSAGL